ncbi:hypothetical protein OROMI_003420 [Orobanche minor]
MNSKPEAVEWKKKKTYKYDELEELFAKDRATGEGAETAKEKKHRWAKANSVCDDNMETIDDTDNQISRNEYNLESFSVDLDGDDIEILVPSESVPTLLKRKRKKPETMEGVMKISFDKISSASLGKFCPRVISFEEITEELKEMGVEGEFFDHAFEFLTDNPEKAKKLFAYPKEGRLAYLEKLVYSL